MNEVFLTFIFGICLNKISVLNYSFVILKSDTNDTPFASIPPDIDVAGLREGDKCFFREVRKEAEETTDDPIKTIAFDRLLMTGCCQDAENLIGRVTERTRQACYALRTFQN
jgi:hypothetical protein